MYLVFDRQQAKWVIREHHLLDNDDENLCFNLNAKADIERLAEILNELSEYEDEE